VKKIIALLLALLLLTGCTPAAPIEPTDPTTSTSNVELTTTAPTTEPAVTEPTTQPVTEPVTEPMTQPATQPVTEPVTEPTQGTQTASGLTVHFLDVQHADAIILACEGEYAVVDAGYPESGEKVVSYLQNLGAKDLELVVGTHPHGDHIGGMPTVLDAYPTDTVWTSQLPYTNDYVSDFTSAVSRNGADFVQPRPGDSFQLGSATIDVIGPLNLVYEDANDLSLVLRVTYGDIRFLLTGDMEELAEKELVEAGGDLKADVLKVGHHGSASSTSYRFLREVAPTYGVISLAAFNEYGHPHRDPLSRLMDADVTIYRTDKMYDIVAFTDGETVTFTTGNVYAEPWRPGDPR
jgi:competence protein ComEC